MSAVTKPEGKNEVAVNSADPFLSMIERFADKPDVLVQLVAVRNAEIVRRAEVAFNAALAAMQPELPAAAHRGLNTNTQKSYAKWEDIHAAITPVLAAHGFALSFKVDTSDKITVTAILRHREGHSDHTTITLPVDKGAGRNEVQSVGSSVSYGKRYAAGALLNFRTSDDDDGAATGSINDSQAKVFRDLVEKHKANLSKLLAYVKAGTVEDMNQSQLDNATEALMRWVESEKTKAEKKAAKREPAGAVS